MTADSELEIRETFQRAQKAHNNKAKLVASLNNTYAKVKCCDYFQKKICSWQFKPFLSISFI